MNYYKHDKTVFEQDMCEAFVEHAKLDNCFATPYIVKGDELLLDKIASDTYKGITATAPGFYAPQGRQIRLETRITDINSILSTFNYKNNKVTNTN